MKKYIMGILLAISNCILFFISAMLISVLPGLLTGKLAIDRQTGIRFLSIYLILYLLIFSLLIILKNIDFKNISTIIKIQTSILLIIYIIIVLFFSLIVSQNFIQDKNFIPFKSIFSNMYYFLVNTEEFNFYSLFRTIIFYIIYLIPLFEFLKVKINNKHYFFIAFIILFIIELMNLIIKKSFDIDHILLGLYGACLDKYIFKNKLSECLK